MNRLREEQGLPGVERLLALSDGVVAIALTLLVLQLAVPTLVHAKSASELAGALGKTGDRFFAYIVAFYIISQYWLAHHRVFRLIKGHDEGLAWGNFLFLFTITLLPFTSAMLGRYGENPLAVDIFAGNMLMASLTTGVVVLVARRRSLLAAWATPELIRYGRNRSLATASVLALSIAIAWVSTTAAQYLWFLLLLVPSIGRRLLDLESRRPRPTGKGH
jgi:TMEM175 potassium channel family protein